MKRNVWRLAAVPICIIVLFTSVRLDHVQSIQDGAPTPTSGLTDDQSDVSYTPAEVAYSVSLDKIRAYMLASVAVWKSGDYKLAASHASDANAVFATISKDLAAQNADTAVKSALDAYEALAAQAGDSSKIDAASQAVLDALDAAEQALMGANFTDTQFQGEVMIAAIQSVETEYAAALKDGKITEPASYQNAVAFLQVAELRWETISGGLENPDSTATVTAQFTALNTDFPDYIKLPTKLASPDAVKTTVEKLVDTLRTLLDLPQGTQEPTATTP